MVLRRNAPNSFQSYSALLRLQPQVLRIKAFDPGSDAGLFLLLSALLKIKALQANTAQLLNPLLMKPSTRSHIYTGSLFTHVCKLGGGGWAGKNDIPRNQQLNIRLGAVYQADDCSCCCGTSVGVGSKQPVRKRRSHNGSALGGLPAGGKGKDV